MTRSIDVMKMEAIALAMAKVLESHDWTVFTSSRFRTCAKCLKHTDGQGTFCTHCKAKLGEFEINDRSGTIAQLYDAFCAGLKAKENYKPLQEEIKVKVGQVWQDNDPRCKNRKGVILSIEKDFATIQWNTHKKTKISIKRFRPTKTGYTLIKDIE